MNQKNESCPSPIPLIIYCDKQKNLKYYNNKICNKYHKVFIETIQHDDVQEYVAAGILDGFNSPSALDEIF